MKKYSQFELENSKGEEMKLEIQTNKLYGNKDEIVEMFGVNRNTLSNDLTEMRRLPQFESKILNVGHKRVYISVEGYEAFLKYKSASQVSGY
jgi:hypothetical protein